MSQAQDQVYSTQNQIYTFVVNSKHTQFLILSRIAMMINYAIINYAIIIMLQWQIVQNKNNKGNYNGNFLIQIPN